MSHIARVLQTMAGASDMRLVAKRCCGATRWTVSLRVGE